MTHTYNSFHRLALIALAGLLIIGNIWAQNEPARNWAAPLYWQPSAQEAAVTGRAAEARLGTQGMTPEATGGATPTPLVFVAVTPCRMMDTRGYDSTFVTGTVYGPPGLAAGETRTVPVAGVTAGYCSLPAAAQAVSVNVTLWPAPGTQVQWITLWPAGVAKPAASTINDYQGTMYNSANGITIYGINNAAIVPLGTGGAFDIYVTNATNLFIDVNGYYTAIGDANANTTLGIGAFESNINGGNNTAVGASALGGNTIGSDNTATGAGALYNNTTGSANTAVGELALTQNATGMSNTATGVTALWANNSGSYNTASGAAALYSNTTGSNNTADGYVALGSNTTGGYDTAVGDEALMGTTTGSSNTAVGAEALIANTTGSGNTATGYEALCYNTTANNNAAFGNLALKNNSTGTGNTGIGANTLQANGQGDNNTALGINALANTSTFSNTATGAFAMNLNSVGNWNTAAGAQALSSNTTGNNNIAIGYLAAVNVSGANSNNIHIGTQGASADNGTIRIGGNTALGDLATQTQFFASGIYGATTGASGALPVVVDSNGQLGTTSSSRTVKRDIEDMGDTTDTLMSLRPVRFRYKVYGPDSPFQYGLVAEEVAEVAPELVARNNDGKIETVFYDKVNAMLLNQVQTQQRLFEAQREEFNSRLQAQEDLIHRLETRLAELESRAR